MYHILIMSDRLVSSMHFKTRLAVVSTTHTDESIGVRKVPTSNPGQLDNSHFLYTFPAETRHKQDSAQRHPRAVDT